MENETQPINPTPAPEEKKPEEAAAPSQTM